MPGKFRLEMKEKKYERSESENVGGVKDESRKYVKYIVVDKNDQK